MTALRLEMPFPRLFGAQTLGRLRAAAPTLLPALWADVDFAAGHGPRADAGARLRDHEIPPDPLVDPPMLPATSLEHDAYFGVRRVTGDDSALFLRALLVTHLEAPLESAWDDPTGRWPDTPVELFEGLRLLARMSGADTEPRPAPPDREWHPDPAHTWNAGHRLFFALIEGAVIGIEHASGQVDDVEACAEGMAFASAFLRSSAAAMRLAAAFDPRQYRDTVRPDMMPPTVSAGFSGLYTVDHKALVKSLTKWRAVSSRAGAAHGADELLESVQMVYASHEFVCERFEGAEVPSLRSAALADGSAVPPAGVALSREFTRRRVNALRS